MTLPTMPWNRSVSRSEEAFTSDDHLSMIPMWSVILAIAIFAGVQYLFHVVMPHHKPEMLPMRLLMSYSWGTAFASYVLLVGYVSRDVKRRRMSAGLCLFHSAAADPAAVSALQDGDSGQLSLLPAMPVSTGSGVREVLPRGADHGCVLRAVRARSGAGPYAGAAAGV
jgi:hypothetical protein